MKPETSTPAFVMVLDQVRSRASDDRVPELLERLTTTVGRAMTLPFERTAGDEVQGLTTLPGAVVRAMVESTRLSGWRLGIGLGRVDEPLPTTTRAARGSAYLAARQAIEDAHRVPSGIRLVAADHSPSSSVSGVSYAGEVEMAESGLWLLHQLLARRSEQGWEIVDLLDQGTSAVEAARRLGISPSAVSQRQVRANRLEVARGAELCALLLARAQQEASR